MPWVSAVGLGLVAPALIAGVVLFAFRRFDPKSNYGRVAATLGLLAGFLVAYWAIPLGPWLAQTHWQWLPYVLLGTAVIGPVSIVSPLSPIERLWSVGFGAFAASCLLVPGWDHLEPARWIYCLTVVVLLLAQWSAFESAAARLPGALLPSLASVTLVSAAIVLVLAGNNRFAQMAGVGAACMAGLAVASFMRREPSLRGVGFSFGVALTGCLLVGEVNSFSVVPVFSYALVAVTPLVWAVAGIPAVARMGGLPRALLLLLPTIACLAGAVSVALYFEWPSIREMSFGA